MQLTAIFSLEYKWLGFKPDMFFSFFAFAVGNPEVLL